MTVNYENWTTDAIFDQLRAFLACCQAKAASHIVLGPFSDTESYF